MKHYLFICYFLLGFQKITYAADIAQCPLKLGLEPNILTLVEQVEAIVKCDDDMQAVFERTAKGTIAQKCNKDHPELAKDIFIKNKKNNIIIALDESKLTFFTPQSDECNNSKLYKKKITEMVNEFTKQNKIFFEEKKKKDDAEKRLAEGQQKWNAARDEEIKHSIDNYGTQKSTPSPSTISFEQQIEKCKDIKFNLAAPEERACQQALRNKNYADAEEWCPKIFQGKCP